MTGQWRLPLAAAVTLLLTWGGVTRGQVLFRGRCPKTPVIHDFDWDRYLGRWNDVYRYYVFYQTIGRCWSGTYTIDDYGQVQVTLRFRKKLFNNPLRITVNVDERNPYTPNKLFYSIPGLPVIRDNYEVLRTDYDNWTIEYSCRNKLFGRHAKQVWILTRSPHPSRAVLKEAFRALRDLGIPSGPMRRSDQSCFRRGRKRRPKTIIKRRGRGRGRAARDPQVGPGDHLVVIDEVTISVAENGTVSAWVDDGDV